MSTQLMAIYLSILEGSTYLPTYLGGDGHPPTWLGRDGHLYPFILKGVATSTHLFKRELSPI